MKQKQVVLVTGASSGFGKLTVERLLERGCRVYASARRTDKMKELAEKGATVCGMDVTREDEVTGVVEKITGEEDRIDALVNNAGYGGYGMFENVAMEEAYRQFEVNVFGAARVMRAVLPVMRQQRQGRIVNISSVVGRVANPMIGWYSASKHALEALTDAVRNEVSGFGVHLSLIEPGPVKTEFEQVALQQLATVQHDDDYTASVNSFIRKFKTIYNKAPGPEAVVDAIVKALYARRPRARYPVAGASMMILFRGITGDRLADRMIRSYWGIR